MSYHQLKSKEELIIELQKLQEENESLKTLCDQNRVDHKHSLDALHLSENRYSSLVNNLPVGIFRSTIEGKVVSINPAMVKIYGYDSIEELLNVPASEYYSQDNDRNKMLTKLKKEGVILDYQTLEKKKDGSQIWVSINYKLTYSDDKKENFIDGVVIDITDSVLIREKLKESEERFRRAVILAPNPIMIHDEDNQVLQISAGWTKHSGYTIEDIPTIGDWTEKAYGERSEFAKDYIDKLSELTETVSEGEWLVKTKNGETRVWDFFSTPLGKINEGKKLVLSVAVDITERKQSEDALLKSENVYRNFIEVLPDGVYKSTEAGSFVDVNQAMVNILGYDNKAELMTVDIKKQLYFDEIDRESVTLKQDMKEMGVYRMRRKDGSEIWVEDHGWLTHDKESNIIYHEGIMRNVTERIKAEIDILKAKEKAEESEIRFKALHNASFGGIAIHDKGIILECNQGLSDVSGFTTDQLVGMNGLLLIAEDSREIVMKNILALYEKPYEVIGLRKNGEEYPLKLEAKNIPYKGNKVRVVEFRDITESKNAEIEIIKALDKAKESDRLKTAFLSNMSHEIRTPMNGILGFSSLLKESDLTGDEQKKYIEIIERSGQRMLNTINDIIDISKVESGQMEVVISEVNVNQQMDYLHVFFAPEAENKNIQLSYQTGLSIEESIIKTDREKIYSILTNLIKNAVKYTHEGRIEFGYILRDSNKLEFYVKDTGIGIPKDRQKAIFDRFVQADIEDAQVYEGSGLGLAISTAYVEMLGGKLWVESVEGKGTIFYFTLPYQL